MEDARELHHERPRNRHRVRRRAAYRDAVAHGDDDGSVGNRRGGSREHRSTDDEVLARPSRAGDDPVVDDDRAGHAAESQVEPGPRLPRHGATDRHLPPAAIGTTAPHEAGSRRVRGRESRRFTGMEPGDRGGGTRLGGREIGPRHPPVPPVVDSRVGEARHGDDRAEEGEDEDEWGPGDAPEHEGRDHGSEGRGEGEASAHGRAGDLGHHRLESPRGRRYGRHYAGGGHRSGRAAPGAAGAARAPGAAGAVDAADAATLESHDGASRSRPAALRRWVERSGDGGSESEGREERQPTTRNCSPMSILEPRVTT